MGTGRTSVNRLLRPGMASSPDSGPTLSSIVRIADALGLDVAVTLTQRPTTIAVPAGLSPNARAALAEIDRLRIDLPKMRRFHAGNLADILANPDAEAALLELRRAGVFEDVSDLHCRRGHHLGHVTAWVEPGPWFWCGECHRDLPPTDCRASPLFILPEG